LGIGYLIGAIAGGFLLQVSLRSVPEERRGDIVKVTELFALGFILPFFFVNVGLNFDFSALYSSVVLTVVTVGIAFLGKFLGAIIVKPVSRLSLKQLYYVGWAMNSRGATELVIALAARQLGLIPLDVFSALVAMSLVSTIVFPSILARGLRRNPGLMNVCVRGTL
jgi:Kef-type K+ transport system membrane component KefB